MSKFCSSFFLKELKRVDQQLEKSNNHIRRLLAGSMMALCLLTAPASFGQLPVVKTSVDKNNILIGEQLNYRVETTFPVNGYRLKWFTMPGDFGKFEVVSSGKIDTILTGSNIHYSQILTITSFDSGSRVIPPLELSLQDINGNNSFKMLTDSIMVEVSYSPLDSIEPFHDIKPILTVQNERLWWFWAGIIAGALLLILLIFYLIKRFRKKKDISEVFASKLSPYDEAMQSISDLEKMPLNEQQQIREFHTELTGIFKRYISRKSGIYKMHFTTDELLMEIKEHGITAEQLATFANSLRIGNVVKFARFIPPAYENENCLLHTKEMITAINHSLNKKEKIDP